MEAKRRAETRVPDDPGARRDALGQEPLLEQKDVIAAAREQEEELERRGERPSGRSGRRRP